MKNYTFKILRFNPQKDSRPVFEEYKFSLRDGATVLDGLFHIHKHIDPSLAFRFSCRGSVCGSCAMNINDSFRLACETLVEKLGSDVKIRPLSNMPVIKDLVVDMGRFWSYYESIKPYLIYNSNPDRENIINPAERKRLDGLIECILCGLCFSSCPVTSMNENYYGPAALLKLNRFIEDSRDVSAERFDIAVKREGIWNCRNVFNCQEVCPKKLSPARAINKIRYGTIKNKLFRHKG